MHVEILLVVVLDRRFQYGVSLTYCNVHGLDCVPKTRNQVVKNVILVKEESILVRDLKWKITDLVKHNEQKVWNCVLHLYR
jgi:hypothetical protein